MSEQLWLVQDIAEAGKVSRQAADAWTHRDGFPPPLGLLRGRYRVWRRSDVEGWLGAPR